MACLDKTHNNVIILEMGKYVYETVDGKRKRVSPFVFNDEGVITEIKQRAIKRRLK